MRTLSVSHSNLFVVKIDLMTVNALCSAESSMRSNCDINQFSMYNETISDSLFEKFNNLSKNSSISDRIINRVTIVKDSLAKIHSNHNRVVEVNRKYSLDGGSSIENNDLANRFTLGISIIQGSDNNVYVKDLVKRGPGERSGIQIGDQVCVLTITLSTPDAKYNFSFPTDISR